MAYPLTAAEQEKISGLHRFRHTAMATVFELIIQHDDAEYVQQAAHEAFIELDRLEHALSRFIPNSDISQINALKNNKEIKVGFDAFHCLRACVALHKETRGAFDITMGGRMDQCHRTGVLSKNAAPRMYGRISDLHLDEENFTVRYAGEYPLRLDLGGFGKGYALERMAALLRDWDIRSGLIHGGWSSILALEAAGQEHWRVTISHPLQLNVVLGKFSLRQAALSGSGVQKGSHIINPRTGFPVQGEPLAAWAYSPDASTSDALSTAFMIMPPEEIDEFCRARPEIIAVVLGKELRSWNTDANIFQKV